MAFGGTNYLYAIPRVRNYAQAEKLYSEVKPVRGDKNEPRPIGNRRRKYERIEKVGCDYVIYSGGYPVVTYKPDNKIVLALTPWASPQFCMWMSRILGVPWFKANNLVWFASTTENIPFAANKLTVWFDEWGELRHNVRVVLRKSTDRKAANKARARIKPFVEYGMAMLKLCDGVLGDEVLNLTFHRPRINPRQNVEQLEMSDASMLRKMLDNDEEDYSLLLSYVCRRFINPVSRRSSNGTWDRAYPAEVFKRATYMFHDSYAPEIYYIEEVPIPPRYKAVTNIVGVKTLDL